MMAQREERPVYGCVGANRPDARPFIEEVDGILVYTCPECRRALARLERVRPLGRVNIKSGPFRRPTPAVERRSAPEMAEAGPDAHSEDDLRIAAQKTTFLFK